MMSLNYLNSLRMRVRSIAGSFVIISHPASGTNLGEKSDLIFSNLLR